MNLLKWVLLYRCQPSKLDSREVLLPIILPNLWRVLWLGYDFSTPASAATTVFNFTPSFYFISARFYISLNMQLNLKALISLCLSGIIYRVTIEYHWVTISAELTQPTKHLSLHCGAWFSGHHTTPLFESFTIHITSMVLYVLTKESIKCNTLHKMWQEHSVESSSVMEPHLDMVSWKFMGGGGGGGVGCISFYPGVYILYLLCP